MQEWRTGGTTSTMSDAHSVPDAGHHPASAHDVLPHGASADGAHGHDDGHDALILGPIDGRMWAAGAVGVAAGLVVVAAFVMGTTRVG